MRCAAGGGGLLRIMGIGYYEMKSENRTGQILSGSVCAGECNSIAARVLLTSLLRWLVAVVIYQSRSGGRDRKSISAPFRRRSVACCDVGRSLQCRPSGHRGQPYAHVRRLRRCWGIPQLRTCSSCSDQGQESLSTWGAASPCP